MEKKIVLRRIKIVCTISVCLLFLLASGCADETVLATSRGWKCLNQLPTDYEGAIAQSTKAIQLDPQNAQAYFLRAGALLGCEDWRGAAADYTKAIELGDVPYCLQPYQIPGAYFARGYCHEKLSDYGKAVAAYTVWIQSAKRADELSAAYVNRSRCYVLLDDIESAARDTKRHEASLKLWRSLQSTRISEEFLSAAVGGALSGVFQATTGSDPFDPSVLMVAGTPSRVLDRSREASMMKGMKKVNEMDVTITDRDLARIYNVRAHQQSRMDKSKNALLDYTRSIKLNPNGEIAVSAYLGRAEVFAAIKQSASAEANLAKAAELIPDVNSPDTFFFYGKFGSVQAALGNNDAAISAYNQAIEVAPSQPKIDPQKLFTFGKRDILLLRGITYSNKGDHDRAIADYSKALKKKVLGGAQHGEIYYQRALSYFAKNQYGRARSDVDLALKFGYKVDPDFIAKLNSVSH